MNLRGTAILAIAVIIVGTYVWFEGAPSKRPAYSRSLLGEPLQVPPTQEIHHFFTFRPADVVEVRLQHEGEVRVTERRKGSWANLERPAVIDDFLNNINKLGTIAEISADPGKLLEFGLQPPRSILELRVRGSSAPLVLLIGDRNPATTGVYVRTGPDGPIALAGALLTWEFDKAFRALGEGRPTPSPSRPA
jgi:hypothetical protein